MIVTDFLNQNPHFKGKIDFFVYGDDLYFYGHRNDAKIIDQFEREFEIYLSDLGIFFKDKTAKSTHLFDVDFLSKYIGGKNIKI